jgi:hypothetical protein
MLKNKIQLLLFLCLAKPTLAQTEQNKLNATFNRQLERNWQIQFSDSFTNSWQKNWFLDGEKATLTQTPSGLEFKAGFDEWDDTCHAVLWTRQNFEGDVRIEFEYTRLDSAVKFANIIYIQATGSGMGPFLKDIETWREYRKVPAMWKYYQNMNTYHISFAAYGTDNTDDRLDYIRARRYMPGQKKLQGTELGEAYNETGFFKPGVSHKICIIKKDQELFMRVRNAKQDFIFHWKNADFSPITEGRIGLRQMYSRSARYGYFRVYGIK